ncbi:MAG: Transcription initiation factor TFIID subunit 12 [Candelina submexicana]|nr:MAG: Transcription initiation factor TFIID subunit 12 [Candelina submexicana]
MNNTSQSQTQGLTPQQQQQLTQFVRVEHVAGFRHMNDAQKKAFADGLKPLWDNIRNHTPNETEYQGAFRRLREISQSLRADMKKWSDARQGATSQAPAGQQPDQQQQNHGQQSQQQQRPTHTQPQKSQQGNPAMTQVNQKVPFTLPPNLPAGTPEAEKWLNEAKTKYYQAMKQNQEAKNQMTTIKATMNQRQESGKPLSTEEQQQFNLKGLQARKMFTDTASFLEKFKAQQTEFFNKAQQIQQQGVSQGTLQHNGSSTASRGPPQSSSGAPQYPNPTSQTTLSAGANPQLPNQSVESTRNQTNTAGNTSMSPSNTGQHPTGQVLPDPPQSIQHPTSQAQGTAPSHPIINRTPQQLHHINTGTAVPQNSQHQLQQHPNSQRNSPQTSQPHSTSQQLPPQPLSHAAAIAQAAQSYANSYPQNNPSVTNMHHPHPQVSNGDRTNNNVKMPIPKNLNVTPPSAVGMGPARPTLSGGPSNGAGGMMGQPAIQRHPQYVLEGEGDRVLSKKKLDELVRQVTGGGEGLGGEGLTAEVEEAVLQVADDFVDQVITSACRLAKLRQSSTLESRDIQLILERNYNIRVPGYASDEIRTVKKFQPAPGWSHKMQAINAAKVMGGKTDL